jgi:large subunit ribosomal protein L2
MKKLLIFKKSKNGRGLGKILCRTKGGGKKFLYRLIDFNLIFLFNSPFILLKLVKDFNRNTFLIFGINLLGFSFYILAAEKIKLPIIILNPLKFRNQTGLANTIEKLNEGSFIFNLTNIFLIKNSIARSAGLFGQILKKNFKYNISLIRLKNGLKFLIKNSQKVLIGLASNSFSHNLIIGKAGKNRNKGFRPIVR